MASYNFRQLVVDLNVLAGGVNIDGPLFARLLSDGLFSNVNLKKIRRKNFV